ncbi:TetR/AcrR family transcriptional regulator [Paractinoplanes globisporus]|uniref:TetR/AcrR family transcriptional regulator n=1 Tax=Paractinoplanes globisporus TaxID=113565 RepID=A0ABW6WDL5_9ACTN|nr:TetR/AcrR family transcriptional regulator [Actinoplanes globisporus]
MRSEKALTRTQQARRHDIVAAAITVLTGEGFASASIERIAREAGASKGTVLYHFKTKEAVHEAVVELLYANGAAYMTARIMAETTYRDRLRTYLSSNLRFIAENAAHVLAVQRILQNTTAAIAVPSGVDPLRDLLAAGQKSDEFGAFDPEVMSLAIRAVVDGAAHYFPAHPDLDVDHIIAEAQQIFEKATAADPFKEQKP